jgi:hypothetical protein
MRPVMTLLVACFAISRIVVRVKKVFNIAVKVEVSPRTFLYLVRDVFDTHRIYVV